MSKKRKSSRKKRIGYKQSQRQRAQTSIRKLVGNKKVFTKSDLSKEDPDAVLTIKSGGKWVILGKVSEVANSRSIQRIKQGRISSGKNREQNVKEFSKKLEQALDEDAKELEKVIEKIKSRPEPTTEIYNPQIEKSLSQRVQEYIVEANEKGEQQAVESKYAFIYELQLKHGLDREKQEEINKLFMEANKKLEEIKIEYGITLGTDFQLFKSNTMEQINKKINAAKEVLNSNYLELKAKQYKIDYISDFALLLDEKDAEEFQSAMDLVTDTQFLAILKETGLDYIVYAWDSLIDTFGYEYLWGKVRVIINTIYKVKGIEKRVKGETHGLS